MNKITDYNLVASVVSFYLQEIECRMLEIIYNYCVKKQYIKNDIAVLCADGLMIEKENYNDNLLTEFENVIEKRTGFKLKFTNKEMNEDYLDILDANLYSEADELK